MILRVTREVWGRDKNEESAAYREQLKPWEGRRLSTERIKWDEDSLHSKGQAGKGRSWGDREGGSPSNGGGRRATAEAGDTEARGGPGRGAVGRVAVTYGKDWEMLFEFGGSGVIDWFCCSSSEMMEAEARQQRSEETDVGAKRRGRRSAGGFLHWERKGRGKALSRGGRGRSLQTDHTWRTRKILGSRFRVEGTLMSPCMLFQVLTFVETLDVHFTLESGKSCTFSKVSF